VKCVVVGAGLTGATAAQLVSQHPDWTVEVYEASPHVGGNLRSSSIGNVIYEPYGPHIFHTESALAWQWVNRFAVVLPYIHTVKSQLSDGRLLSWPPQVEELKELPEWQQIAAELDDRPAQPSAPDFERYAIEVMGATLYSWFCEEYTRKQWGTDPHLLSSRFAPKRIDLRTDGDRRLFRDQRQGWVLGGFQTLVERLLAGVPVHLGVPMTLSTLPSADAYVITAPLDDFLGEEPLPWRGIRTEATYYPGMERFKLAAPVVNRPGAEVPWTRETETKQMAGQGVLGTIITREYPGAESRYYPVDDVAGENRARWRELRDELQRHLPNAQLAGRLATYTYIDMDQAIIQAVHAAQRVTRGTE
jgi:UDP-galactopyranose mutase